MASPIRQTGASKSQIPIPSLLPLGAASATGAAWKTGAANGVWAGDPGGKIAAGNGDFVILFEFGKKSRCDVDCPQEGLLGLLGLLGLGAGIFWTTKGNEPGIPLVAVVGCGA